MLHWVTFRPQGREAGISTVKALDLILPVALIQVASVNKIYWVTPPDKVDLNVSQYLNARKPLPKNVVCFFL